MTYGDVPIEGHDRLVQHHGRQVGVECVRVNASSDVEGKSNIYHTLNMLAASDVYYILMPNLQAKSL